MKASREREIFDKMRDDIFLERELVERHGVVYFVQAGHAQGPVKIGFVSDPRKLQSRIYGIQSSNHEKIFLIRKMHGLSQTEKWLHKRFSDLRIRGEWYLFHEEMLSVRPPKVDVSGLTRTERNVLLAFLRESEHKAKGLQALAPLHSRYRDRLMRANIEEIEKSS
jgi:hypothetical protein